MCLPSDDLPYNHRLAGEQIGDEGTHKRCPYVDGRCIVSAVYPFSEFALEGFGRVKKKGLNDRYRLFFKAFEEKKRIFIIWLGYPRKEGDKDDCYAVFTKMVDSGELPTSLGAFMEDCGIKS